jgi:transketolase
MPYSIDELSEIARRIRIKTIDALYMAQSGHPGPALSIVEILTALFFDEMNLEGEHRDRFVLSKGHAVTSLYAVFAELQWIDSLELETLRRINTRLQGHPDRTTLPYLDAGSGALGQGASMAIGYALASRLQGTPTRTYCIIGDGENQEGQIWEAAMHAPAQQLDNLVFIIDENKFQNEDYVEKTLPMGSLAQKWQAFGWRVLCIDGHNFRDILYALKIARKTKNQPTMIIADTVKGKGVEFMENNMSWHSRAIKSEEYQLAMSFLLEK